MRDYEKKSHSGQEPQKERLDGVELIVYALLRQVAHALYREGASGRFSDTQLYQQFEIFGNSKDISSSLFLSYVIMDISSSSSELRSSSWNVDPTADRVGSNTEPMDVRGTKALYPEHTWHGRRKRSSISEKVLDTLWLKSAGARVMLELRLQLVKIALVRRKSTGQGNNHSSIFSCTLICHLYTRKFPNLQWKCIHGHGALAKKQQSLF